jgi:hypothetical protein
MAKKEIEVARPKATASAILGCKFGAKVKPPEVPLEVLADQEKRSRKALRSAVQVFGDVESARARILDEETARSRV